MGKLTPRPVTHELGLDAVMPDQPRTPVDASQGQVSDRSTHDDLLETFEKFSGSIPRVVFDIGSRDGEDARRFADRLPTHSDVYAFECNPDTIELVRRVSATCPSVHAVEYAVSDRDGSLTFWKIDPASESKYSSQGNPGASSLFQLAEDYPEALAQIPITVSSVRLDSWMKREGVPAPDLIWMDLQGAEVLALRGLGSNLGDVGLIYTEAEFRPYYENQGLARDLCQLLRPLRFYLYDFRHTTVSPPHGRPTSSSSMALVRPVRVKGFETTGLLMRS